MQARDVLDLMRAEHETNDCGFFAFTMIRPPLDWIVSLYDDICHRRLRGHKDTCPQQVSGAERGWAFRVALVMLLVDDVSADDVLVLSADGGKIRRGVSGLIVTTVLLTFLRTRCFRP